MSKLNVYDLFRYVKIKWKKEAQEEMELTKDKKLQVNAFVLAVGPAATGN